VHRARLEHAYTELEARLGHDLESFGREWRAVVAGWSFARVNRLIDEHNARYPIERSLPFDPEAGDYTAVGGRPYRRALLDASWVFERFPPASPRAERRVVAPGLGSTRGATMGRCSGSPWPSST
jgi:hypothetical protein